MQPTSIWQTDAEETGFPALSEDLKVDVAIVGGGITGITAAHLIAQQGASVAVIEALGVGEGTTGMSTGNLYATVDKQLYKLRAKYDRDVIGVVARARGGAVDLIERLVTRHGIDCRFERTPYFLISESPAEDQAIDKEAEAAAQAGLTARIVGGDEVPLPYPLRRALRIENQAQLNPLTYTRGLARAIASERCRIYEHTRMVSFEEEKSGACTIDCAGGARISARHLVMATHTPKGLMFVQTLLGPYREYGVAVRLGSGEYPPPGIYWVLAQEHKVSLRSYRDRAGQEHLLAIGEPHKVGQEEDNAPHVARLEKYLAGRFDVAAVEYRWGAQHYRPADMLPYIGRRDSDSNVHIATGYSTDGLVYGTLAAMLVADEIAGVENVWARTFAFTRHRPFKAAAAFIKENANVALQYLKDLPLVVDVSRFEQIPKGEGRTIEVDRKKYAAYRDEAGHLQVVSAVCTHLGCVVNFNRVEKTWDCPCHGSRFAVDGAVIEGPALKDLKRLPKDALAQELANEHDKEKAS